MEFVVKLLFVLVLVMLNGFFVASEFALVAVRKTRIDELARGGSRVAKMVQDALLSLDIYISSTQLGITLASLALGWIGEPAIADFIEPLLGFLSHDVASVTSHSVAVTIAFALITFLHIVLGELAPKTVALVKPEKVSLMVIGPLTVFTRIFKPFIFVLNGAGNSVLKILGFKSPAGHQTIYSEEEIKMILKQSVVGGAIEKDEADMVSCVFNLGDISVRQIMVPRTQVTAINVSTTLDNVIIKFEHHPHSRFPVYEDSIDNVIGFVHIKDIYKVLLREGGDKKISQTSLVRNIIAVPETKRIDDVLLDMQSRRVHIAMVEDEYGGTAGIVTLEDIIESLVGEIQDEFESPEHEIAKQEDGSYLIDGMVPIEKIQERFSLQMKGQGYMTIGGLTFGLLGRDVLKGDFVQIGDVVLNVEEMARKRIKTIRLKREVMESKEKQKKK